MSFTKKGHLLQIEEEEPEAHRNQQNKNEIAPGGRSFPKSDLYHMLGLTCAAGRLKLTSTGQKGARKWDWGSGRHFSKSHNQYIETGFGIGYI